MYRKLFQLRQPTTQMYRTEILLDRLWVIGLLIAALTLYLANLGGLPLRDWDEGIVAQVAREIALAPEGSLRWLYPTLAGDAYINKPPLVHILIATTYSITGIINEWTTRLPGSILTALSVPLLYSIGREIFPRRLWAIFSALVYLTLLPVVRHGRLAMLDGAILCFFLLTIWCLLRCRRDLRYCLGVGIGLGLIALTKGVLSLLLGAIALAFIAWDTPRLLTSIYFWSGIIIGSLPATFWYAAQLLHPNPTYVQTFINQGILNQSLKRIWDRVDNHAGPPWYYILEILKYNWPWLIFLPKSVILAWENRNLSWAKLILVWSSIYLLAISIMITKLPWYVLPIYPALALLIGAQLAELWNWPSSKPFPRYWFALLSILIIGSWAGCIYFARFAPQLETDLVLILAAIALTMSIAIVLMFKRDLQFIIILFWGSYLSLFLLMNSDNWVWELTEQYPVKPVAQMIQKSNIPPGQKIYTSYPNFRPSLNFYSERQVIPATQDTLEKIWQTESSPYFLLRSSFPKKINLEPVQIIDRVETNTPKPEASWVLITKGKY
ncbi:ArnT family glycosyltransferase [Aerosakkonemataceae cyanobacterium BLCC-F154]|uniref:ArnT family glycosyltransferase n=1 Tax=Floridaenema fluviatile BLCC-F154 TaxID=3153640 RepID=A0ABV4YEN6_9CYAN